MKVRYKARYDFNPQKAMELRQQWWEQGRLPVAASYEVASRAASLTARQTST